LIEARAYVSNIVAQQGMVSGSWMFPIPAVYRRAALPVFCPATQPVGLGWPLGVVAWSGPIWLTVRAVRRRTSHAQVVILAWVLPYLAVTGAFHAKFLRYMAPVLPFLLICGAGASVAAYRWLAARWGRRGRVIFGTVAGIVVVTTVAWCLAFVGIYRQEHPLIRASRWIYENVPAGSRILTEHWDEGLPLRLDGSETDRRYDDILAPNCLSTTRTLRRSSTRSPSSCQATTISSLPATGSAKRLGGFRVAIR